MNRLNLNQLRWMFLLAATLMAVYVCWLMLKPFIAVLAWASVLVIIFYPLHRRLVRHLRRPGLTAALSTITVVVVILTPLSAIGVGLIHELSRTAERVQGSWLGRPSDTSFVSRAAVWLEVHTGINGSSLENLLSETARTVAASITGTTLSLVGGTIGAVFQFFFVIITMYYLFRDGDQIVETVRQYLPMEDKQSKALIVRAKELIGASVYGVIAIAALQGTLGGLAFWILGIPSALLWGVVMAVVSMIPVAGAWVVWIPAVIYLAGIGSWEKAIALGLWGALFISTIDNFLRPRIVGRRTHLHELLVFFGVLGGLRMFGVLGIILGPVALTTALILLTAAKSMTSQTDLSMNAD